MPDLYYGPYDRYKKPQLYVPSMRKVESSIFDSFKLEGLAPVGELKHVANIWFWADKRHTIIAWHDDRSSTRYESMVFIPSLMNQRHALEYARTIFPEIMPSPITFRFFQEYDEVLLYD